jgi:hypothetical protein
MNRGMTGGDNGDDIGIVIVDDNLFVFGKDITDIVVIIVVTSIIKYI